MVPEPSRDRHSSAKGSEHPRKKHPSAKAAVSPKEKEPPERRSKKKREGDGGKDGGRGKFPNIIDMVPVRNPDYSYRIIKEDDVKSKLKAGWVAIHIPRFRGRLGQGFCRFTGMSQHINLNLDEYGTLVWLNMDGQRTVRQLGLLLKEKFGEKVEPLYWRLAYFLSLLERNKLMSYKPVTPLPK